MSVEKEKMEKLGDLLRFIDLMVRQTCRRAHYYNQTRTKTTKEDKNSIYSSDHLNKVYDKPREYIYQLVKNPQKTLKGLRVENVGPIPKKDSKFTKIEQKMLLDFVKKVQDQAPKPHFIWIDLQHYLFYAYRNFACQFPKATTEALSTYFVCEMRELLNCLRTEDESQVWLRIFTLLREYCIFAQWHYSQNDKEEALRKFFSYYEAMLTAAKCLVPVFANFEKDILYKNYRVCWIDFNTFIFIRFFYESDRVKPKIDECLRTKKSPGDTLPMFASMHKLKKTWSEHQAKMVLVNQEGRLPENTPEAAKEKKVLTTHKKLLSATFWVDRTKEVKKIVDIGRMDHNLFDLLKDKQFFPEGPGLNKNGQCICEECLIAKYKVFLDSNDDFAFILSEERTTYCRKCKCVLKLEEFQRHVNDHVEDLVQKEEQLLHNEGPYLLEGVPEPTNLTRIMSEKMDFVQSGDSTAELSEMFIEKLRISDGGVPDDPDINTANANDDRESIKLAYEKFVQTRAESSSVERVRNGRHSSLREELIANGYESPPRDEAERPASPNITLEKFAEAELLLRHLQQLGHKPCTDYPNVLNGGFPDDAVLVACAAAANCDCTYCEVFGKHKLILQPRDKLRLRYFRKRERLGDLDHEDPDRESYVMKLENRVPLPPSPSSLLVTPPDASDHSATSGKMNEIRGLVNYIEGNTAKNKAERALKKAAKKARQREKREQEKLQTELDLQRKLEEETRRQEELKKQLEKERQRQIEQKKLDEAKMKKKLKKQRQAQKRQEVAIQKNTIEETIPAIVTIKRVPGEENGTPSVTITVKGCTPDQDKLLTTLVAERTAELQFQSNKPLPVNKESVPDAKAYKKKKSDINVAIKHIGIEHISKQPKFVAKDLKVTLALDKNPVPNPTACIDIISEKQPKNPRHEVMVEREPTEDEIKALGNLKLPPGITITKVEGPVINKTYLGSDSNKGTSMIGKSGVIVVDTEKLIQKTDTNVARGSVKIMKKKKKKNRKNDANAFSETKDKPKMVTLRNPMFQHFPGQNINKPSAPVDESAPASIFTSENGMVTIRSSRLQQSLEHGMGNTTKASSLGKPLTADMSSDIKNFSNPNPYTSGQMVNGIDKCQVAIEKKKQKASNLNAQEILSGLPGIEITKIDKKSERKNCMVVNSCQSPQVSISTSNDPQFDLGFDKDDDWLYDSVFKPRDVLEEDMDEDELEVEAFKRFCQQSVPAKKKEVANFKFSDLVLNRNLT